MEIVFFDREDNVEEIYQVASFGSRLAARLIDVFIIFLPSIFIPLIPSWLYWALQQSGKNQATVGQKAMGIRVIAEDGGDVDFGRATGRFFGNFLNLLTFGVGFFMHFMNDEGQCLHDKVSGCIVVNDNPRIVYLEEEEKLDIEISRVEQFRYRGDM